MNIPARYAAGYLGDIGVPPDPNPMDFSAWFEAYLGGHWHTFDARHNRRRIGRVLIGRGRDAGDVPIAMVFGQHLLEKFTLSPKRLIRVAPRTRSVSVRARNKNGAKFGTPHFVPNVEFIVMPTEIVSLLIRLGQIEIVGLMYSALS
jgi:hypothetical protein